LGLQRFHGIDRSIWDRFSKDGNNKPYDVVLPGFKSNMSDLQAAVGVHQLSEVDKLNERRRYLSDRYLRGLAELKGKITPQAKPDYDFVHSGHLFPVCLSS
jgi:dTDP-4-amino-4,6-dideoxygalactose transaminase